jgi:hypothetical protein
MRMWAHRRDLARWKRPAGPADPYHAPRPMPAARPRPIRWVAWTVRTRWRPIFLVTGGLLIILWMAQPSTMAFVPGMLVLGLAMPDGRSDAGMFSHTAAMVRAWSQETHGDHK